MCVESKCFAGKKKRERTKNVNECIQCLSNENDDYDDNDSNNECSERPDRLARWCRATTHSHARSLEMKTTKRNREEVYAYRTTTITRAQDIGYVSRIDAIGRRRRRFFFFFFICLDANVFEF